MARIAIVGVGAIGGVVASLLETAATHQITLCTRRPLPNLTVKTPDGTVSVHATNLVNPAAAEPVDWVLVATKAYDAEGAGAWLRNLCRQGAPAAILQNGVEHRERFASYLNPSQILPVIIDCPAERQQDGSVHQRGTAYMHLEDSPLAQQFAALFQKTKAIITLTPDFLSPAWRKLCINSIGAISALVGKPSIIFHDEAIGQLALDVVAECAAVGAAEGAHLDKDIARQVLAHYRNQPPDSINSLLADRLADRPMEIAARNGVIVRKGEKHGIPTPINKMIVTLLESIARKP